MRRSAGSWVVLAACLGAAAPARAVEADDPDDPKIARRLGARSVWGQALTPAGSDKPAAKPVATAPATSPVLAAFSDPLAPSSVPPPPPAPVPGDEGLAVIRAPGSPPAKVESSPPRLKLAFRRFDFVRIGASGSPDGSVAREPFNSISVEVYPVSNVVRVGLSTQYGWQSGTFVANGDYFAAESLSLGGQLPGGRVVPFAEVFGGIGYMRRLQFDRTIPTAYWQLGVDVGAEIYLARMGFVSVALGYLRPVNGFARLQEFQTVFVDTWSFKLGLGI